MVYNVIPNAVIEEVSDYLDDPMTATTFSAPNTPRDERIVTAEIIYYWMTVQNIPFECEKWHLNRLIALIRVCSIENAPKKKMSKSEIYSRNRQLNEMRRKKYGTKG